MTDDLVKRLRDKNCCDASNCNCDEAADSIESWKAGFQLENERWAEAQDRIEALEAILRKAQYMRQRQKQYFKDRTQDNLVGSKQAEAAFDRAMAGEKNEQ